MSDQDFPEPSLDFAALEAHLRENAEIAYDEVDPRQEAIRNEELQAIPKINQSLGFEIPLGEGQNYSDAMMDIGVVLDSLAIKADELTTRFLEEDLTQEEFDTQYDELRKQDIKLRDYNELLYLTNHILRAMLAETYGMYQSAATVEAIAAISQNPNASENLRFILLDTLQDLVGDEVFLAASQEAVTSNRLEAVRAEEAQYAEDLIMKPLEKEIMRQLTLEILGDTHVNHDDWEGLVNTIQHAYFLSKRAHISVYMQETINRIRATADRIGINPSALDELIAMLTIDTEET